MPMVHRRNKEGTFDETRHTASLKMRGMVGVARREALRKHGPLKGGMDRWMHHLSEECEEARVEMFDLGLVWNKEEARDRVKKRLLAELAQIVQLASEMMILTIMGKEMENGK